MPVDIVPFHADLIAEAGALLARRHRRDHASLPELPPRFEDPAVARAVVEAIWKKERTSGMAAVSGGQLLGYMIGEMVLDNLWGRSAWIRLPGCALAPDQSMDLVHNLYAALGAPWVAYGCFFHFTLAPIADPALVHAWFALGFGIEQVHALLNLERLDPPAPTVPPDVEIRRAGPDDREALAEMSDVIWRRHVQAPIWGIHLPESDAENRAGWAELADDPTATVWLAFCQGQVAGMLGYWPTDPSDENLHIPERSARFSVFGTREWARGRGIGQALTQHALAHAQTSGYRYFETDWRSADPIISRFLPRQGFRPVAYRLVRRIDPRITWANGQIEDQT